MAVSVRRLTGSRQVGWALAIGLALTGLAGCGGSAPSGSPASAGATAPAATTADGAPLDAEKIVNVYNWSDYIDPTVVPAFEKEYGIKVNYDVFDSNEVLETKLLSGRTGYDVVVPSASFLQRQIQAGVFRKLDKSLLPNLKNEDPEITRRIEINDPGNQYGVNYFWGTSGVGYNRELVEAAMPNAPVDSFAMVFDPKVVKNFKKCGVSVLDAPDEIVSTALVYLGIDPNSESLDDLRAAEKLLISVRPYISYINSSKYIEDLANGDICVALGWSGDFGQSRIRAQEAGKPYHIEFNAPREGTIMFFDMLAIPADAPHPYNAHLFINYLLRPDVAARNSNTMHYTNSNAASYKLIDPAIYKEIYPTADQLARMHPDLSHTLAYTRELNRTWTRFKTGH